MSNTKQRPPLTPTDSSYVGVNGRGWHVLVWPSQSRPDLWHETWGDDEHAVGCSCEAKAHWPARACKHQLAYPDALRHHLGEPAPADPGAAFTAREREALLGAAVASEALSGHDLPREVARAALAAEDPGGAALDAAQVNADDEADAWQAELRRVRHDEGLRALYGS